MVIGRYCLYWVRFNLLQPLFRLGPQGQKDGVICVLSQTQQKFTFLIKIQMQFPGIGCLTTEIHLLIQINVPTVQFTEIRCFTTKFSLDKEINSLG